MIEEMNKLGKMGLVVSPIGFGGIVVMGAEREDASNIVAEAVEFGINYFDVAPSYGDAEVKLGAALEPFRKDVHLACKTLCRDAEGAEKELAQSLKNLRTDHFDVYQFHAVNEIEKDVKPIFAKGGAIEAIERARKNGVIRNVGFSSHSPETALAAMSEYDFDTVMLPVNFCLHFKKQFEVEVLAEAKKREMGIIALKTLAKQKWQDEDLKKKYPNCWYEPIDDPEMAKLALGWTLGEDVSVAISPGDQTLLKLMMSVLSDCERPNVANIEKLRSFAEKSDTIF